MKTITILLLATALTVGYSTTSTYADDKKPAQTEKAKPKKKRDTFPYHGKLGEVNKKNSTFTIPGKTSTRIFHVTASTRFEKGGEPAKLEDGKSGEAVAGVCKKRGDNEYEAVSVRFGPKPDKK